jgi:predicted DCC family thiol-disulfide oxidoreductase YuxK
MTLYYVSQRRCRRCDAEVQILIEADAKRRAPRFPIGKDLTTWTGKGAAA